MFKGNFFSNGSRCRYVISGLPTMNMAQDKMHLQP